LGQAGVESYSTGSVKPIGKEVIRQAGGWAGAAAGFEAGFATGALVGVETGPGALLFGLAGGLIFGTASYFGASWAANKLIR